MFYRNQGHMLQPIYPVFLQGSCGTRGGSSWDDNGPGPGPGPVPPGGFIVPLIAGGITGALLAGAFGHKQAYAAEPYPAQGYPVQAYPTPVPTPVPYYQPMPSQLQMTPYQSQPVPEQTQVVHSTSTAPGQGYPSMPSIQGMPNDIMIQKQGQAYMTNPPMPSNQVTNSMPYYMFPVRYR